MRSILVHTDRSPAGGLRVETALALARVKGGHVTALVDTPVNRYVTVDAMGGGAVAAEAMQQAVDEDDAFAREIDARISAEDVPFNVLRAEAEPADALAEASRLADLVVVARRDAVCTDLPVKTRTPVLAVNDDAVLGFPLQSVAIAWDGSPESAFALRSAVPLLKDAVSVTVLTVANATPTFPGTDALSYLSRHGIEAEARTIEKSGSIEVTLAHALAALRADLFVLGAFGHSRMREFLFGGVTRYFLDQPNGPALLLAH